MASANDKVDQLVAGTRIIILIGPLELGGAERQAILLARYLTAERGAKVEVWGYGKPGRAAELCDQHGIAWRSLDIQLSWGGRGPGRLMRLFTLVRTLRAAQPDVLLPYMFLPSVPCAIVWRLTGARFFIWNQRCEGRDRLPRWMEKLAVRATPCFVANSEHGAEFLKTKIGVDPARLHVVHNGVELPPAEWDRKTWRDYLKVNDDCFLACMVANLQTFKDHVTLLKAWRIVADERKRLNRQSVLLLAGRFDEMYETLRALASELSLGETVRFLGQVKDISGLLNAVDVGVHSSVNEGCPNGVLECMASALPVVGTDYPGIREAVGPDGSDFLAPAGDAAALAERIITLANSAQLRARVGAANRVRIENDFSARTMYQKMLTLITEGLTGQAMSQQSLSHGPVLAE